MEQAVEAGSSLPEWAQLASVVAIALISTIVGVLKYIKTKTGPATSPASEREPTTTVAAFADSKLMKSLIEELQLNREDITRDGAKTRRVMQDLADAIRESSEAIQVSTDTSLNLIKFMRGKERAAMLE